MSWGGYGQPQGFQQQQQQPYGAPPAGYQQQQQRGGAPPGYQQQYGQQTLPGAQPGAPPQGYGAPPGLQQRPGMQPGAPPQGYNVPPGQRPGAQPGAPPQGYSAPPGQQPYGATAPPSGQQLYGDQGGQRYGAPNQAYGSAPPPQGGYGAPGGFGGTAAAPPGVDPEIWGWFLAVDEDKSQKITATELQKALMNNNWSHFNGETCRLMIGMFDKNRSGTIDIQEFSALWKYIQEWRRVFESFDRDRSGNIDANELHNALNTFGYRLSVNFAQLVVMKFDRLAKRSMKFDDFIQACVMLKSLTDKFRGKDTNQSGNVQLSYEDFLELVLDNTLP